MQRLLLRCCTVSTVEILGSTELVHRVAAVNTATCRRLFSWSQPADAATFDVGYTANKLPFVQREAAGRTILGTLFFNYSLLVLSIYVGSEEVPDEN